MNNFVLSNRGELSQRNYIRIASPETNYWVSFAYRKLKEYSQNSGSYFNLIIAGDESIEGDFYILPFFEVDHIFIDDYLYYEPVVRWVASITHHQLHLRNCPTTLDIGKYYGAKEQIYLTYEHRTYEHDQNEYAIENRKIEINARQKQSEFRQRIMSNFSNKCCLSGISEQDLLVASHIIPWSERIDTRLDPSNGLCLFVLYDKLFDNGYFSFDDNFEVIVTSQLPQLSEKLQQILTSIRDQRIQNPVNIPINVEYLRYHRQNIFKL